MKQLLAVGSVPELAGPPAPPVAVRAATPGVGPDEQADVLGVVGYAPPPARPADSADPLPVRLTLTHTPAAGRVLAHVAPGADGRYVAHALLHVPPTADAHLAVQTWNSPLWVRTPPDHGDLPPLPYLPVSDALDDDLLKGWLAFPGRRDLVEFALAALLSTPPTVRVFVAGPAADAAWLAYAVTRAVPPGVLDDLTFSTYESDPLGCTARLVGHDPGDPAADLPDACYQAAGVGFHPRTGRRSELPEAVPFAAFAADRLAAGDPAPVDDVKATWQRLGLTGARAFDLVYRLARGTGVLTKAEAAEALQYPPLAAWVSARADALAQFLEWALDDREFATAAFSRAVQALRQKPDALARLAAAVRDRGLKAVRDGDRGRTENALEVVLPMAAPAKANAVWGELAAQLTDPTAVPWDMRLYLLPRLIRFRQQALGAAVDPDLVRWVAVPPDQLADLLATDLPRPYQIAAGRASLGRPDQPTADLARVLAAHPGLTLTLLQPADPAAAGDGPVRLFELLLAEAPGYPWLEELLAHPARYPGGLLERFFDAALAADRVDADRLVRSHGDRLLELFAGRPGLDRLARQFLASPPPDLLSLSGPFDFLQKVAEAPDASFELLERVAAVRNVRGYLAAPGFDPDAMAAAASGLAVSPPAVPPTAKGEVFAAVAREVLRRADADALQADLEAALVHLGDALAAGPADLYENLLRDFRGRVDLGRRPDLVHAFLALALGAAKHPALAGKLDGLDGHAFAVASDAAKRGGRRLLAEVDRRSADWPKPARVQWGFLRAAVEPPGLTRVAWYAGTYLAGAATVLAVGQVLKRLG